MDHRIDRRLKYIDGVHFSEKKHWLHDDYVKFIRMAEALIAKNGQGVVGFITNHGYLDNSTFRGMRWHLLQTFDVIYVWDLHGNVNKREMTLEGLPDKNVFDIQQGVAVVVAVKRREGTGARAGNGARIHHRDSWGTRESKNEALWSGQVSGADWLSIQPEQPYYMFSPTDFSAVEAYQRGFKLDDLLRINVSGIITARDEFVTDEKRASLLDRVLDFADKGLSDTAFQMRYHLGENYQWKASDQRKLIPSIDESYIEKLMYRLFEERFVYYQDNLVFRPRREVMRHMLAGPNLSILSPKISGDDYSPFVSITIIANKAASRYDQTYLLPLYLYPEADALEQTRRLNFDPAIYARICQAAGLTPSPDAGEGDAFRTATGDARPAEVKVFDYIYAVLHAPAYRATYAEFLRIDFPRIPYPHDPASFAALSAAGERLRRLHLMEPAAVGAAPFPFTGAGDDTVASGYPRFEPAAAGAATGRVHVNATQGFDDVPAIAWDLPVGGYRPAQKWLKDRRGRVLSFADIGHYQRIVKVLAETDRLMRTIALPPGEE